MDLANDNRGFTLFETLVATMIFAIALVVLLQLFSGGLRANFVSDQYTRAVFHAREKMEELLLSDAMAEQLIDGEWKDGFFWKANISPRNEMSKKNTKNSPKLFQVDLEVSWNEGGKQREIAISTVALKKALVVEDEK